MQLEHIPILSSTKCISTAVSTAHTAPFNAMCEIQQKTMHGSHTSRLRKHALLQCVKHIVPETPSPSNCILVQLATDECPDWISVNFNAHFNRNQSVYCRMSEHDRPKIKTQTRSLRNTITFNEFEEKRMGGEEKEREKMLPIYAFTSTIHA